MLYVLALVLIMYGMIKKAAILLGILTMVAVIAFKLSIFSILNYEGPNKSIHDSH